MLCHLKLRNAAPKVDSRKVVHNRRYGKSLLIQSKSIIKMVSLKQKMREVRMENGGDRS